MEVHENFLKVYHRESRGRTNRKERKLVWNTVIVIDNAGDENFAFKNTVQASHTSGWLPQ